MARHKLLAGLCVLSMVGLVGCGDDDVAPPPPGDGGGLDGTSRDAVVTPDGFFPDGNACAPLGEACGTAAECCSGNCDGSACIPSACSPQGVACAAPADCCSGVCTGGLCAPDTGCTAFGTACATGADCCSGNCSDTAGLPCAGGAGCACAPSTGCHASGDPCANDAECCNGLCSMGMCAEVGACRTAGEPCGTEGLNGSCCSAVCLAAGDDAVPRCQFLGGCRVQDDLCASDGECCSGSCAADGMTTDGRPIMRCANVDSCLPVGERCNIGVSVNCCPNGGGDMGCEPTAGGFSRCFGGGSMCVLAGMPCTVGGDPCCPEPPGLMCTPGTPRGTICCLPDGAECAFGDLCCGGVCAPDASGVLRCGSSCVPDGGACTVDADCCGCCRDTVCVSGTACGACTGPMLGELCDPAGPACCDAPAVICNTAVEFPTCILAM